MTHRIRGLCSSVILLALAGPAVAADEPGELARKAREVLVAHCQRCHAADGKAKGGFDYVTQLDRLVARNKVAPARAAESELWQRMHDGDMPPRTVKQRPTPEDVAAVERWIAAGAPAGQSAPRRFVAEGDTVRLIRTDLDALPERQRRFMRYFSLAPLANAGRPDEELDALRHALGKLVNALSWHPRVTRPVAVDETAVLYRIDLRDYKWNARLWERLVSNYPYRFINDSPAARENATLTGTEQPHLRADWFVATASRPPLYYDLVQMPGTAGSLERLLQVDAAADIQEESVARAGFNGSGVSKNNRLLERHDAGYGAYWRTYDFSDNTDRQNLFDHPLGPPPAANSFVPAGGEAIFHLPNGLHAYLLMDGAGRRVEKAPVEIVSDPQRPDRAVEAGLSCMSCHARGYIHKADQVRGHVLKNAAAFPKEQVETVKALYPKEARFRALIDQDNERYLKALAAVGVPVEGPEPVNAVTLRYEGVVDLAAAAAESGLSPDDFQARLGKSATLNRALGPLQVKGGTVQRQTWQLAFADLVRDLRLSDAGSAVARAVPVRPFTGHGAAILCIAFSADGRRAVSGSEDRTVRLWDVDTGQELRRFTGHTAAVAAVALSPDGKRLLSGGHDRSVRLWDAETGRPLHHFVNHTDHITSLAFAPDGRRAAWGTRDGALLLCDLGESVRLHDMGSHSGCIGDLAFSPDSARLATASHDRTVRLWDVDSGKEVRRLEGHTREVYAVAFTADGRSLVSSGNDRTVRLWDAKTGAVSRTLEGHRNAVIRLATVGEHVLSGASQYQTTDPFVRRWRLPDGTAAGVFGDTERISCIAFSVDGSRALTDGPEFSLRLWKLETIK